MTDHDDPTDALVGRARRALAYGGLDGIIRRPPHPFGDWGALPQFAASSHGCTMVDTGGRSFIDWVNGWGPVLLGHRHPRVEAAIRAQLESGTLHSLMHPVEIEVAEMLVEMIPCAEMVAFGKNGSDGLTAAVRLARAFTGREHLLYYGFHGFHDWYAATMPQYRGVPAALRESMSPFDYNDPEGLARSLEAHAGRVAAVIMEPVREIDPAPGFLAAVRELAHAHGALLIFDEVVTALRLGNGGAQEAFGVVPDLACLGKSLANGMPLSAIVGPRRLMQHLPAVGVGMTFRGESLSLAAAREVLRIVRDEPVAEHLATIGERARGGFRDACARTGVAASLNGPAARMTFVFDDQHGFTGDQVLRLFLHEVVRRDVLTNGILLPSAAHDDAAVDRSVAAFEAALGVVAEAFRQTDRPVVDRLPPESVGCIDDVRRAPDAIGLVGWLLVDGRAADRIEAIADGRTTVLRSAVRTDVGPPGDAAGFEGDVPLHADADGSREFVLHAIRNGRVRHRCRIVVTSDAPHAPPFRLDDGVAFV